MTRLVVSASVYWAHLDTATAGPRTVPVRSGLSGVKTLELSRIPRPSDVLRAGTARAPVVVSRCAHPVEGSLVLLCFCYSAQELKPKSNFNRQVPILIAAAVVALVCLAQALPLFSPRFDLVPRLE